MGKLPERTVPDDMAQGLAAQRTHVLPCRRHHDQRQPSRPRWGNYGKVKGLYEWGLWETDTSKQCSTAA
eukprot:9561364-Prorocentrum_lima.AAC.1